MTPTSARPHLGRDDLAVLYRRSNVRPAVYMCLVIVAIVAVLGACERVSSPWAYLVAILFIGALQHHLSIVQHEANHYLLFTNRRWNEWMGALAAQSIGFTMSYRAIHSRHHQTLGTESDPDLANYRAYPLSPQSFVVDVLKNISGWGAVTQFVRQSILPPAAPRAETDAPSAPPSKGGLVSIAATQLVIVGLFCAFGHWYDYGLLWLLPLVTVSKSLAHFRNVVEHTITRDNGEPELSRYRTIECSAIERFFFAPMYFNFHAEHHFYPGIPYFNLPEAHRRMKALPEYGGAVCTDPSYLGFLLTRAIRWGGESSAAASGGGVSG